MGEPRFRDALSIGLFIVCLLAAVLYAVLGWWISVLVVLVGAAIQTPCVVAQYRAARTR